MNRMLKNSHMQFEEAFSTSKFILTEVAIVERLKKEFGAGIDAYVNHAGLIYDSPEILSMLYRQYIEIAQKSDLPVMLMTPTRRVNFETISRSKYAGRNLISDACNYLTGLRSGYPAFSDSIFIGGLLGCRGDAYQSEGALDIVASYEFHKIQVAEFAKEKIDFLFAGIMPALSETIGMAKAMAESGIPYIISFMIRKDGCLLDGTSIADAVSTIDGAVDRRPVCYMANCIHPANLRTALDNEMNNSLKRSNRFLGIQANASALGPDELNNCGMLHQENFDEMLDEIIYLINKYHFKILGGCCGTDHVFIEKLAAKLTN
jgi:S-methylmethionine-dependent homocysteine/selenocysteine methylase